MTSDREDVNNNLVRKFTITSGYSCIFLQVFILSVVGLLVYSNSLSVPFVFDDRPNIVENSNVRVTELSFDSLLSAGFKSNLGSRPVANISFALNYYFNKYNVFGFHLVNVIIHVFTGIFLYCFILLTLNQHALKPDNLSPAWIAFFASVIWLVHPINTQSVTYIVQRMNSMASMFYMMALLFYVYGRLSRKLWQKFFLLSGSIVAAVMALGSKEIAITLPFFIILYEWFFLQDLSKSWLKKHLPQLTAVIIITFIVALLLLNGNPLETITSGYENRDFTLTQRLLTQFRVILFYISLLFFPHPARLNLDHDFSLSHSILDPSTTLLSLIILVGLLALAVVVAKKERLVSFCILWFLGNLAVESSVIGLEMVFEHRTYLPSMMLVLLFVFLMVRYIRSRWLHTVIFIGLALMASVVTYNRNTVWQSELGLWQDVVKKSPEKARGYNEIGMSYYEAKRPDEALPFFLRAVGLKPDYDHAINNLGLTYLGTGRVDLAIDQFKRAIEIIPGRGMYHINLGIAFMQKGMFTQANKEIQEGKRLRRIKANK